MARLIVHVVAGPEHPTPAASGFIPERLGTGSLRAHYAALRAAGLGFHLCRNSSAARALGPDVLEGQPYRMTAPDTPVRVAADADTVLTS